MKRRLKRERVRRRIQGFWEMFQREHNGVPPTFREVADGIHISLSSVKHYVDDLIAEGVLADTMPRSNSSRSVVLAGGRWLPPRQFREIPGNSGESRE
jgi:predicted transcriptional regulator